MISSISGFSTQQSLEQNNRRLKRENEVLRLLAHERGTFFPLTTAPNGLAWKTRRLMRSSRLMLLDAFAEGTESYTEFVSDDAP